VEYLTLLIRVGRPLAGGSLDGAGSNYLNRTSGTAGLSALEEEEQEEQEEDTGQLSLPPPPPAKLHKRN